MTGQTSPPVAAPASLRGRRGQLGAWVADQVAEWIVRGGLRAGDPIPSEAELATSYEVSVRVVRDALRVLSSQGVIQTSQGRRAVVANRASEAVQGYFKFATASDASAIAELFEVRIALETRAAGLAALHGTDDEVAEIRTALEAMRFASREIEAYADADLDWHAAVVRASHNRFLVGIHTALSQILRNERISGVTMRLRAGDSADVTLDEHAAVTTAILQHDRRAAESAMSSHLDRARHLYEDYLGAVRQGRGRPASAAGRDGATT
jgi:GntR family transcriptional regulator, transcriptional repressor for pyruvate dehydrogenase complex